MLQTLLVDPIFKHSILEQNLAVLGYVLMAVKIISEFTSKIFSMRLMQGGERQLRNP